MFINPHKVRTRTRKLNLNNVLIIYEYFYLFLTLNYFIFSFPANNLYGYAQSFPLPIGRYEWMSLDEAQKNDWENVDINGKYGYILQVDLEYPNYLHKDHSSYPLAPEKMKISFDLLSDYAKKCHEFFYGNQSYKAEKLVSTLGPKLNYVIHFANLQFYLQMGLKLSKIHRVLRFEQSRFLKQYIDYCTAKRHNAKSDFQKNIWKLSANSCYGKFIEQVRNRLKCHLITKPEVLKRKITKNEFSHFKIINENLVAAFSNQTKVTLNKIYSVGFSILEFSKLFMYKSYYLHIKPHFKTCSVLFTDTDSFCLSVSKKAQDKDTDALDLLQHLMDYSNYDKNHPKFDNCRKGKLGYFKDETKGLKILEFTGIRSKTYSMKIAHGKVIKRSKGISKAYQSKIAYKDFKKCLKHIVQHNVVQYNIRSKNHHLQTLKVSKLAFSSFDDKRMLLNCAVHSYPYFSKFLVNNNFFCQICNK